MSSVGALCLVFAMCFSLSLALESYRAEDGYEVFPEVPGSRYKLTTLYHSWPEALTLCQGDGGGSHLVIINSQAEAEVVKQLFTKIQDGTKWLLVGINDIAQEGNWITIQGGLVSSSGYNLWQSGEPNDKRGEDCGAVGRDGLFNDFSCSAGRPFICEKPNV